VFIALNAKLKKEQEKTSVISKSTPLLPHYILEK